MGRGRRCALAALMLVAVAATAGCGSSMAKAATVGSLRSAPVAGTIGVRLLDVPAAQRNDPRARLYIVDHLAPGAVTHRRIEVTNTTSSTANVVLYPAGAVIVHANFLGLAGKTPDEVSTWTSVVPDHAAIPAGGSLVATVTIAVPAAATSSERYGAVWAEVRSTPASAGGVTEVSRVGIRIYLSVGFGAAPASNFAIRSMTAERRTDGQPVVLAAVRNTGGLALDMSGFLRLRSGPAGLDAGPFPAQLGTTLAIGATEAVTFALDRRLPAGPWDARVTLRSGLLERSARATIIFPRLGRSPAVLATTSAGRPWWQDPFTVVLVALLAASVVALGVQRRRHPRRA